MEHKIIALSFPSFILIDTIETCENLSGIIAISQESSISIIAYPGKEIGSVMIKNYKNNEDTLAISAHQTKLSRLALNIDGKLLATCSEMGTVIRLFNTYDGSLIRELRRGSERAEIYSISFDHSSKYLTCSSNTKKVSIFSLSNPEINTNNEKLSEKSVNESVLNKLSLFLKISPNEHNTNIDIAFSQFKIVDEKAICCFGKELNLFIISSGGTFYHITFDSKQRDCYMILNEKYLLIPN